LLYVTAILEAGRLSLNKRCSVEICYGENHSITGLK